MARVVRTPGPGRALLAAALKALAGKTCQVGWFESSKYADGTPVAYIAAIHEFGYAPKNIPPRMGLREMSKERKSYWSKVAEQGARQILDGRSTADEMMELLGGVGEADVRKQIASVTEPPLLPATIKARQNASASGEKRTATGAKPLVDSGYLLATVSHVVLEKGETDTSKVTTSATPPPLKAAVKKKTSAPKQKYLKAADYEKLRENEGPMFTTKLDFDIA